MAKAYNHYCPVAHALDQVGDRWALLVVRELLHGPLRYTDLLQRLGGCATNVLAARLRELETSEIVRRRALPPPAASVVYELTEEGMGLQPVLSALARWGARTLGPPPAELESEPGWLERALRLVFAPVATDVRIGFRVGDEQASIVDGESIPGIADDLEATVQTDMTGFYHLVVDGSVDGVEIEGDRDAVTRAVAAFGLAPALPV